MARRSITDEEIALIKAMLAKRMQNKDIQFFFNRPDRAVNSGRISTIKGGTYGNSAAIAAASEQVLSDFIANFKETPVSAAVSVPSSDSASAPKITEPQHPLDETLLASFFTQGPDGIWRFKFGETDIHECKVNFGFKFAGAWLRAVAGLANNRGGYILFGVHDKEVPKEGAPDKSYEVIGLPGNEFANMDPMDLSRRIKATFDPTPRVQTTMISISGKSVGVFHVEQHSSRPVIATKTEEKVVEGDIFYRYPGQSTRIKYSDLRALLDDRDRQARKDVLPMVERLLQLGPRRSMIADLDAGEFSDGERSIYIDENLLKQIAFIREGEFDEVEGAATLRLVGDVRSMEAKEVVRKSAVTRSDLIQDFLRQELPYDGREYIRCAVEGGQGEWLPIFCFAQSARLRRSELLEMIDKAQTTPHRKKVFVARVTGKKQAYHKPLLKDAEFLQMLEKGELPEIDSERAAIGIASAICGLKARPPSPLKDILGLMARCCESTTEKAAAQTQMRRTICRIDELYFAVEKD